MPRSFDRLALVVAVAAFLAAGPATAQVQPPPQNVLSLSASAATEVTMDLLSVALAATREGSDAASVQAQLKTALDAALAEARRVAKPGQVDVQTGNFALFPRYGKQGQITGWQGRAELLVEGRDMAAIAQLTGRINTLQLARVAHALSREAREKVEAEVSNQAIARFREKAQTHAQAFGFAGYTIREVQLGASEPPPMPVREMRMRVASADAAEAPLPVEAGRATVSASVSGSVQMTK
jgi:predicted secreted protein